MRPLAIDMFTGCHGWAHGLVAAGFHVLGVDIEDMSALIGEPKPDHFSLWIQDVRTLHGSQFKDAALIVASPPCQFFSYCAMPWSRAKELAASVRADQTLLAEKLGLFNACFRIQAEASAAAGRHVPLVIENVRGAQSWVGRARGNFGSYYLWSDVPALMPQAAARKQNPDGSNHIGSWFGIADSVETGRKVAGFRFDGGGRSFQTAAVEGMKTNGAIPHIRDGAAHTKHLTNSAEHVSEGRKHHGDWFRDPDCPSRQGGQMKPPARVSAEPPAEGRKGAGAAWFDQNTSSLPSASPRRKAASARIARIPFTLAHWIGRCWLPQDPAP